MSEEALSALLVEHSFSVANLSHRLKGDGRIRRYSMVLQTRGSANASRLADTLEARDTVLEFRIAPTGD